MSGALNLWMESALGWKITQTSLLMCKIFPFYTYTMLDYSIGIIVIMTGKKLFAVLFPMRANNTKFNRNDIIIALSLLVVYGAINSHLLFSLTLVEINLNVNLSNNTDSYVCTTDKWLNFYDYYWFYIDATIYSFLPFTFITFFNILIIVCLIREKKKRIKLQVLKTKKSPSIFTPSLNSYSSEKNNTIRFQQSTIMKHENRLVNRRMAIVECHHHHYIAKLVLNNKKKYCKNNSRLTIMLFLINISFCVLTMPIVILGIINQIKINNLIEMMLDGHTMDINEEKSIMFDLFKAIFELLQYLNHCINFFLYCLSGATFRHETLIVLSNIYKRFCR